LKKCGTVGKMRHTLKLRHTSKNARHLPEMCHIWKNAPHFKNGAELEKIRQT